MKAKAIRPFLSIIALFVACSSGLATLAPAQSQGVATVDTSVEAIKQGILGDWVSIAPEIRPSASKKIETTVQVELEWVNAVRISKVCT
jgi:hypothetical protein